ncbi:MAG: twin-arginine translocase subunit TatC, partial [Bacteroidota bacterium]
MNKEDQSMSFLEHLEELRKRLFRIVLGLIVGVVVVVIFDDFVIDNIIMAPRYGNFPTYEFFCWLGRSTGLADTLCLEPAQFTLQSTTMGGNFSAYMRVIIVGGIVLSFPHTFHQIWMFIKPGLKKNEIQAVRGIVFYVSLLFFSGALFGYYVLSPLSIQFLGSFDFGDVEVNSTVVSYLKLCTTLVLGTGIVFQLPILVYFLSKIGVVSSAFLKKYRRHAFVVNLIIAAIITPPDVTSQLLVSLPILLLYEL